MVADVDALADDAPRADEDNIAYADRGSLVVGVRGPVHTLAPVGGVKVGVEDHCAGADVDVAADADGLLAEDHCVGDAGVVAYLERGAIVNDDLAAAPVVDAVDGAAVDEKAAAYPEAAALAQHDDGPAVDLHGGQVDLGVTGPEVGADAQRGQPVHGRPYSAPYGGQYLH